MEGDFGKKKSPVGGWGLGVKNCCIPRTLAQRVIRQGYLHLFKARLVVRRVLCGERFVMYSFGMPQLLGVGSTGSLRVCYRYTVVPGERWVDLETCVVQSVGSSRCFIECCDELGHPFSSS